jgi:hypothetical protein
MEDYRKPKIEADKPEMEAKQLAIHADHSLEHETTIKQVLQRYPALVWWCFYWAMAAVGW